MWAMSQSTCFLWFTKKAFGGKNNCVKGGNYGYAGF